MSIPCSFLFDIVPKSILSSVTAHCSVIHCKTIIIVIIILCVFINSIFFSFSLPQESCQNYIRILTITTPGTLLACGTNSYRPMCHYYNITGSKYHLEKAKPGQALCPYGPKHNSTSVFVGEFLHFSSLHLITFDEKIALEKN